MNAENRNQVIILVVLAVVLLGVVYMYVIRPTLAGGSGGNAAAEVSSDGRIAAIAENVQTAFVEDNVDIDALLENVQDVRFVYSERNLARNPMIPLVGQTVMNIRDDGYSGGEGGKLPDEDLLYIAERIVFTGLIWDEESPIAIVDNELVHVGYSFDVTDIVIKEIQQDSVVVEVPLSSGPELIVHSLKESTLNE